ncbi:MAG: ribonuclease P protein component, partial [Alphaproteobacteria bacterium]|nr:ribonuclease P protein component [Alphaproteobacteria bacterium]
MSNKLIQTLKRREEFIENKRKGVSKKTPFFVLRISDSDQDLINVGFVVTKKGISKKAVVRNLVKRRLREVA